MSPPRLVPRPGEYARCSIAGFTFPLNPDDIQESNPRTIVEGAGITGAVLYDFGNGVRRWTITGQVGAAGRDAIIRIVQLKAADGQPAPIVNFAYPYKYGHRVFRVQVGDVGTREQSGANPFQFHYTILLREVVPNTHAAPLIYNGQYVH